MKKFFVFTFSILIFFFPLLISAQMPPPPPNDENTNDGDVVNEATLYRAEGDYKVYEISAGKKHWIPTAQVFDAYSFNWNDIQTVTQTVLSNYSRVKLLRAEASQPVYYLTNSGMIRHIPTAEIFESYGNDWNDVFEISSEELGAYEKNILIRAEGDYKVYLLENNTKHWIKTAEIFNQRGYDWFKIAPVNQTEINYYQTGQVIE